MIKKSYYIALIYLLSQFSFHLLAQNPKHKNIIFILADDHRHDFMGFTGKVPGLQTPALDQLAAEGMHFKNAFCTTALCSPSRASMLTGQYAHTHKVVDNVAKEPKGLIFFPKYLQNNGYQTAFLGKWHMGNSDEKRDGFDYWACLKNQGEYYKTFLNINGNPTKRTDSLHFSDYLTDLTLNWLDKRDKSKPFFIWMSHKAVHADFQPAQRHKGIYKNLPVQYPASMFLTANDSSKNFGITNIKNYHTNFPGTFNPSGIPQWVHNQRYSWHGVDYMYHGEMDFNDFYRRYLETLLSVDESVASVLKYLKDKNLEQNTMIVYVGDNGFSFGEHGLIDKRHTYEESMRIPLIIKQPKLVKKGQVVQQLVKTIDFAPTLLEWTLNMPKPIQMEGKSFLKLLKNEPMEQWNNELFYEYYWESNFPSTPTMHAIRTDQFKYIRNYGVWDTNELYDLKTDPMEVNNLIKSPLHQTIAQNLQNKLWQFLEKSNAMQIPLKKPEAPRIDHKHKGEW